MNRKKARQFLKDWMLVISMVAGAGAYLIYHGIPALWGAGPALESVVTHLQPVLLFIMLFLSFTRIEPHQLRPHRWQARVLLVQVLSFLLPALGLLWAIHADGPLAAWIAARRIPVEAALVCLICPTATACAVVTGKLGGNMAEVVTYTIVINVVVSVLVPLVLPLIYPVGGLSFTTAMAKILAKVFPLLIMPCLSAWLVRYLFPRLHAWLVRHMEASFYIWAFSLSLAILMSTRAIVFNEDSSRLLLQIAAVSLLTCIFQFWAGRRIGARSGTRIEAGQALGQKNTVFAIWMGYTFMDPIISVAGGFYSIWHNVYNSWQLHRLAATGKNHR